VALLKLGAVGDIHLGTGLWAMVGLVTCTAAAIAGIDRLELWDRLEIAFHRND
jgi:paraquat-inducible protein A